MQAAGQVQDARGIRQNRMDSTRFTAKKERLVADQALAGYFAGSVTSG
jgi:hypothetical protein